MPLSKESPVPNILCQALERYDLICLLQQYVIPDIHQQQCLETNLFKQDGAPPHVARQVIALLGVHFGDERVISRGFPIAWSPRFPELKPCDNWLWKFLKDHVYKGNIETVPELKESITCHVSSIDRETLHAAIEYGLTRFKHVTDANGMHIEQICD